MIVRAPTRRDGAPGVRCSRPGLWSGPLVAENESAKTARLIPLPLLPMEVCLMLSNGRPSIRISTLPTMSVDLCEGRHAWIKCRTCKRWVEIARGLVQVHRPDGKTRCAGSRQHIVIDLTPEQHRRRTVAARHAVRAADRELAADAIEYGLTHVPVPPAVHQIAARTPLAVALRARRAAAIAVAAA